MKNYNTYANKLKKNNNPLIKKYYGNLGILRQNILYKCCCALEWQTYKSIPSRTLKGESPQEINRKGKGNLGESVCEAYWKQTQEKLT